MVIWLYKKPGLKQIDPNSSNVISNLPLINGNKNKGTDESLIQDMNIETHHLNEVNPYERKIQNYYAENKDLKYQFNKFSEIVLKRPIVKRDIALKYSKPSTNSSKEIVINKNQDLIKQEPNKEEIENYKMEYFK